jgi:two-component system, OmpR family, KDP operon response regulator KdpE
VTVPDGGLRVLLVDDDPRVRTALGQELTMTGCRMVATGPEGALETASRHPFDVALVDVGLPAASTGLRLITELATTLPVVALSINGANRDAARVTGAREYLEKDGDTDRLLSALRSAAESRRFGGPDRGYA